MKRMVFTLRWDKAREMWAGPVSFQFNKKEAVKVAALHARYWWTEYSQPSQLRVYNKLGRICFERTYGRDPKRTKG